MTSSTVPILLALAVVFTARPAPAAEAKSAPFGGKPHGVPGTIEAEEFDEGGEGVAYHDSEPANRGAKYGGDKRSSGVDMEAAKDPEPCITLAFMDAGEWVLYTVDAKKSGLYTVEARVASKNGGAALQIEIDGKDVTGVLEAPKTGDWSAFTTVGKPGVKIAKGKHQVRVRVVKGVGQMNVNYLRFAL